MDVTVVSFQNDRPAAGPLKVPQPHSSVVAARGQARGVWRECHRIHGIAVARKNLRRRVCPDPKGGIAWSYPPDASNTLFGEKATESMLSSLVLGLKTAGARSGCEYTSARRHSSLEEARRAPSGEKATDPTLSP